MPPPSRAATFAAVLAASLGLWGCGSRWVLLDQHLHSPAAYRPDPLLVQPLAWSFAPPSNWDDVERWSAQVPHFGTAFQESLLDEGERRLPRGVTLSFPSAAAGAGRILAVRVVGVVREWTPFAGCDYLIAELELQEHGKPLLSATLRANSREPGRQSWLFSGRITAASRNLAAAVVELLARPES